MKNILLFILILGFKAQSQIDSHFFKMKAINHYCVIDKDTLEYDMCSEGHMLKKRYEEIQNAIYIGKGHIIIAEDVDTGERTYNKMDSIYYFYYFRRTSHKLQNQIQ
jgi:hypothetical protein